MTRHPSGMAERVLRRVAVLLLAAVCGLVGGVIAWPALRTAYYVRQSRSSDATRRVKAINVLGSLCTRDPSCARDFVGIVLEERTIGTAATQRLVDQIAAWTLERSQAVRDDLARRLHDADEETFLHIASLLARGGHWRRPERSWDQLAKREILRTQANEPATRLAALRSLADLGPGVSEPIADHVATWLLDPAVAMRVAVVRSASICLDGEAVHAALSSAMRDAAGTVRTEAVVRSALRGIEVPLKLLCDHDARVRRAATWAFGMNPSPEAADALLQIACNDADADVRAMAAWALGQQKRVPANPPLAFLQTAMSSDTRLAARVIVAAARLGWSEGLYDFLPAAGPAGPTDMALAAVFAIGQIPADSMYRDVAVSSLRRVVEESLRRGQGTLGAAGCEALATLDDRSFMPVLRGVARKIKDQPMLRYTAAVSALRLDERSGVKALVGLSDCGADAVCDLASIRLGGLTNPPFDALVQKLVDGNERSRASAALALGFAGMGDVLAAGERFDEFVRRRTDPTSDVHEQAWKPHGYYLCARLLLGDDSIRERLDPFIRNEHFPRVGLYASLLRRGDLLPMDLLLARESTIDVESFLRDARFIEIFGVHFPDAPSFDWFEDKQLRDWQVDRLRDWWSINKWRTKN